MAAAPFESGDRKSPATMRMERMRGRMELMEMITGARQTMAESRTLLAEADAILAREKLPLVASQGSSFDAGY